jgi:hypothetical protein
MIAHAICFGVFAAVMVLLYGFVIRPLRQRVRELESQEPRDTIPSLGTGQRAWTVRIECRVWRGE